MELFAQILSYLGLAFFVLMFQMKDRKKLLLIQIPAVFVFAASYVMTGAVSGAVLNLLALVRALVFYRKDKWKWVSSPAVPAVFVVLSILSVTATGLLTGAGFSVLDLLPMAGMVFTSVSFWMSEPRYIRFLSLPSSPCWIVYLSYFALFRGGAWGGVIAEAISMTSVIVAIVRFDVLPLWSAAARAKKPAQ